jgi:hypothetical protein
MRIGGDTLFKVVAMFVKRVDEVLAFCRMSGLFKTVDVLRAGQRATPPISENLKLLSVELSVRSCCLLLVSS